MLLDSLVITGDTKEIINLDDCGVADREDLEIIVMYLRDKKIKKLILSNNSINNEGTKILNQLRSVDELDLSHNNISKCPELLQNGYFSELNLSYNSLGDDSIKYIKYGLDHHLNFINVIGNSFSGNGMKKLQRFSRATARK
jgi:Leucine-rich repeat (LRR) protein